VPRKREKGQTTHESRTRRTDDVVAADRLVVAVLGVWRVTHLLEAEDGPWDLAVALRRRAGTGFWGGLLDCFHCLSLWAGAVFACAVGRDNRERALLWPALSAGAVLLERVTTPAAAYVEDRGDEDVLRQPEAAVPRN
jgi:hypothetical protein